MSICILFFNIELVKNAYFFVDVMTGSRFYNFSFSTMYLMCNCFMTFSPY